MKCDMGQSFLFCYTNSFLYVSRFFSLLSDSLNGDTVTKFPPQFLFQRNRSKLYRLGPSFLSKWTLVLDQTGLFSLWPCVSMHRRCFKQTAGSVCSSRPCSQGHVPSLNHCAYELRHVLERVKRQTRPWAMLFMPSEGEVKRSEQFTSPDTILMLTYQTHTTSSAAQRQSGSQKQAGLVLSL